MWIQASPYRRSIHPIFRWSGLTASSGWVTLPLKKTSTRSLYCRISSRSDEMNRMQVPCRQRSFKFRPDVNGGFDIQAAGGMFKQQQGKRLPQQGQQSPLLVASRKRLDRAGRRSADVEIRDAALGQLPAFIPIDKKPAALPLPGRNARSGSSRPPALLPGGPLVEMPRHAA